MARRADPGKLFDQRPKTRDAEASNQHAATSARFRQTPRAPHPAVTVHVRDHDNHVRTVDEGFEGIHASSREVSRMNFDAVPARCRQSLVMMSASFDAADESDVHLLLSAEIRVLSLIAAHFRRGTGSVLHPLAHVPELERLRHEQRVRLVGTGGVNHWSIIIDKNAKASPEGQIPVLG